MVDLSQVETSRVLNLEMIEVGRVRKCRDLITRNVILRDSSEKIGRWWRWEV